MGRTYLIVVVALGLMGALAGRLSGPGGAVPPASR